MAFLQRTFLIGCLLLCLSSVQGTGGIHYSEDALRDEITDLPGLPSGVTFKMFSGYIPVNSEETRKLFYWFVESSNNPETDPIALWTNGGPGCSGLAGFLLENGPFRPTEGGNLTTNPYAWNQVANMIFIEQPAGVGFSVAEGNVNYGDEEAATDNYNFIIGFFQKFSAYSSHPFYLTSESYGGHYLPTLAKKLVDLGGVSNFKGFAVGNPLTYLPYRNYGQYATWYGHQLLPKPLWDRYLAAGCGGPHTSAATWGSQECNDITGQMDTLAADIDPYALDFPVCVGGQQKRAFSSALNRAQRMSVGLTALTAAAPAAPAVLEEGGKVTLPVMGGGWRFAKGPYACGGDHNCLQCTTAEAQAMCEKDDSCQALYLDNCTASPPAPDWRGDFSLCSEVLGPTVFPADNCFFCRQGMDCGGMAAQKEEEDIADSVGGYYPANYQPCDDDWGTAYLNRADVQAAIHAVPMTWSECSNKVGGGYNVSDTMAPMMPYYQYLAAKGGLNILVYSGDDDSICATRGSQQFIWDLGFKVTEQWAPWILNGQTGGMRVAFEGLQFVTVHGAGHLVPATRPQQALQVFKNFLSGSW